MTIITPKFCTKLTGKQNPSAQAANGEQLEGENGLRYLSIQYLRAAAVMSVLVLHSHDLFDAPLMKVPLFSDFGWVGVRLFFIISGFIVADRICRCASLGDYLIRRFLRVFPLYFVVSIFTAFVALSANEFPFVLAKTDSGMPFEPNGLEYFLKSVFIVPQDEWPLFAVGWSLEFEIVFYAIFGFAYFTISAMAARLIILAIAVAGLVNIFPASHFAHPFMLYFFAGCFCSDAFRTFRRPTIWFACMAFLPTTVVWIAHLYGSLNIGGSGFTIASTVSFSSLLILFLELESRLARISWGSWIIMIGDATYSIYLCHWLIFRTARYLAFDLEASPLVMESIRILILACALVLSVFIHRKVESPMNDVVQQWARKVQALISSRRSQAGHPVGVPKGR